jgi:hypothetical protein
VIGRRAATVGLAALLLAGCVRIPFDLCDGPNPDPECPRRDAGARPDAGRDAGTPPEGDAGR